MEQKNRLMIVIAIVALIVGAMLTSFGLNLFALNTPQVVLPSSSAGPAAPSASGVPDQTYQRVEVTARTVAGVVATLSRPTSYYRELTVDTFWNGGSSSSQVQVWADGGWTHSRQTLPSGVVRHDLTDGSDLYYWYEGSQQYQQTPADEKSSDLAQHIPTYETILELESDEILSAGYENRGELPCILAEIQRADTRQLQRFWVSVDSGLLVAAEAEENGQVIYRMTAYSPVQSPCPNDGDFSLPDGTILHTTGEFSQVP